MRQLRATGERNRLRIAEPPQQSRRVFLRLKSPPEGGIWGGVRLVNDANGGDNTIGSKPTERKINKLHKRMNNKYSLPKDGGLISESAPRDIIHRYEKIHTKVYENEYEGVQYVADNIVKAIRMYNEIHCSNEVYEESQPFVLGLTTGRTPLGLYRELVKRHHEGQISFRNVSVYSLDEFYPIRSTEQQSRNYRIHEEFLNHIDILPENVHIPDGTVPEDRVSEYCASYDHSVRRIDLMIIGVGEDGQIGFNEPGSYSRSRTRLVQLTYNTRKIQSGAFFGLENTPKMAVTMGIDTIMRANRIILMAWGEEKAHIVQRVVEGEITDQVPASYLQAHQNIDVVIDVGVSGPGVVNKALQRAIEESGRKLTLSEIAEVIKHTAYKVTRVGELIGRGVAKAMDIPFGVADLSLAPTPAVGDSVGEIFQTLGLSSIGAPGSTAILAMLNDAVKKGGVFASSHVGGLSGAFIPVSEDSAIEAAARSGALTMEKLEAMTCVCSVGLDMIAIPGDTPAETISAMIADEAAIGMINSKTTAVRIIPVPGKTVGDVAVFGGLLGEASIIRVPGGDSQKFIDFGGRIPAPIHSLRN